MHGYLLPITAARASSIWSLCYWAALDPACQPGPRRYRWARGIGGCSWGCTQLLRFCFFSLHFLPVSADQTSVCFESEPKWPQRSETHTAGLWIVPGEPYVRHFTSEGRAASVTLQSYHSCGYKHSSGFLWWFKTVSHRILSRKKTFIQEFKGFFGWLVNSNWTKWLKCLASPPQPPKPPDQGRPFSRTPQTWAWQPGSSMAACFIWIQSYCCGLTAVCAQLLSCVLLFATSWPVAHQASLSMEFSRQEYWSEVVISSSRGSSQPRNRTHISCVSCILRWILYHCATWEAP